MVYIPLRIGTLLNNTNDTKTIEIDKETERRKQRDGHEWKI